ncbi:hypothetical protein A2191_00860 [Candidatus Woesebacteria bacterium RIFOXYA1_FULL_38_9]|nr:MAG: hypothetical protein A2191_00860 [Candidatus Woesebacteria bacterium RIFOXYA1_FULL_38_9]
MSEQELLVKFRAALAAAQDTIYELEAQIAELTTEPYRLGLVLAVSQRKQQSYKSEDLHALQKVRVNRPDSDFHGLRGKLIYDGIDYDGDIRVRFHDGSEKWMKPRDIEFEGQVPTPEITVLIGEGYFQVTKPFNLTDLTPGEMVLIGEGGNILYRAAISPLPGEVSVVLRVLESENCEVSFQGSTRVVFPGKFAGELKVGNRVQLDGFSGIVIMDRLPSDTKHDFAGDVHVPWDKIAGYEEAKRTLQEAIGAAFDHPRLFAKYNMRPIKGVILSGPPGCGKTMMAKAVATQLCRNGRVGFFYIKGPEVFDMYVGNTEAAIRAVFAKAREFHRQHDSPAVIFVDEADAIMGVRRQGRGNDAINSAVAQFLSEMDGLDEEPVIVIIATNRADMIDPAIARDQRMDRKLYIGRPDQRTTQQIFGLYLRNVPFSNGYSWSQMAEVAAEKLMSDYHVLFNVELEDGRTVPFCLRHIISGAMIEGIVQQAASYAFRREVNLKEADGLELTDLTKAISATVDANRNLNHDDAVMQMAEAEYGQRAVGIRKNTQARARGTNN